MANLNGGDDDYKLSLLDLKMQLKVGYRIQPSTDHEAIQVLKAGFIPQDMPGDKNSNAFYVAVAYYIQRMDKVRG